MGSYRTMSWWLVGSLSLAAFSTGCASRTEIESSIERGLNVDIPGAFRIIENKIPICPGETAVHYVIEFSDADFQKLLAQMDLSSWTAHENDYFSYQVPVEGDDYLRFSINPTIRTLSYLYVGD